MKISKFKINIFIMTVLPFLCLGLCGLEVGAVEESAPKTSQSDNETKSPSKKDSLKNSALSTATKKKESTPSVENKPTAENNTVSQNQSQNQNSENNTNAQNDGPIVSEDQEKKEKSQKNKNTQKSIDSTEEKKAEEEKVEFNLPSVTEEEVNDTSNISDPIPSQEGKPSVLRTVISWALIAVGIILILKVLINNFKISKDNKFNYKGKHHFKNRKYNLKYK